MILARPERLQPLFRISFPHPLRPSEQGGPVLGGQVQIEASVYADRSASRFRVVTAPVRFYSENASPDCAPMWDCLSLPPAPFASVLAVPPSHYLWRSVPLRIPSPHSVDSDESPSSPSRTRPHFWPHRIPLD